MQPKITVWKSCEVWSSFQEMTMNGRVIAKEKNINSNISSKFCGGGYMYVNSAELSLLNFALNLHVY